MIFYWRKRRKKYPPIFPAGAVFFFLILSIDTIPNMMFSISTPNTWCIGRSLKKRRYYGSSICICLKAGIVVHPGFHSLPSCNFDEGEIWNPRQWTQIYPAQQPLRLWTHGYNSRLYGRNHSCREIAPARPKATWLRSGGFLLHEVKVVLYTRPYE